MSLNTAHNKLSYRTIHISNFLLNSGNITLYGSQNTADNKLYKKKHRGDLSTSPEFQMVTDNALHITLPTIQFTKHCTQLTLQNIKQIN